MNIKQMVLWNVIEWSVLIAWAVTGNSILLTIWSFYLAFAVFNGALGWFNMRGLIFVYKKKGEILSGELFRHSLILSERTNATALYVFIESALQVGFLLYFGEITLAFFAAVACVIGFENVHAAREMKAAFLNE